MASGVTAKEHGFSRASCIGPELGFSPGIPSFWVEQAFRPALGFYRSRALAPEV